MRGKKPGDLIQIDHMTVKKNGLHFKHFQAWDPVTKMIVADVTSNATSYSAAKFLKKVREKMSFKVHSIQVDGGSEFMRDFEIACKDNDIKLYVLPPKKPQYNGGVERGNRIFREEFYDDPGLLADSIGEMRYELERAVFKYNTFRPHFSLQGLTPKEYTDLVVMEVKN